MAASADGTSLYDLMASIGQGPAPDGLVGRSLQAIRAHLGMDVAYVSEFVGGRSVFREVDAPGLEALVKVGDSHSLDDVYCRHILAGRLPQLMPDTAAEPLAMSLPITAAVPIGKHMSVPIRMPDGSVHGMFCCLGFKADPSLHERDIAMMRVFADLAAFEIARERERSRSLDEKRARIQAVIDNRQLSLVYQPICELATRRPVGFECLARFQGSPMRSPDQWFLEASETDLAVLLELSAVEIARAALSRLPQDVYLAVNASPGVALDPQMLDVLGRMPVERVVLEITEHAAVADYDALARALEPLRVEGLRLAVDDAGAGYSSLNHILRLAPDLIKLDMALTRGVDLDPARRALAAALVGFARDTGSVIIAEGVETASELAALAAIGVERAQGYFLGRPMPLEEAVRLAGGAPTAIERVA